MAESELEEEAMAINSIYPDSIKQITNSIYEVSIVGSGITVRLSFPSLYPDQGPNILDVKSSGNIPEPKAKEVLETSLQEAFSPGMVCIFEFLELSRESLQVWGHDDLGSSGDTVIVEGTIDYDTLDDNPTSNADPTSGWFESDPIVDRKSVFIGRARGVVSVEEAEQLLDLLKTNKKIAKATHNMTCWRIRREDGVVFQDYDDDGESAAGGRLLHLLTLTDSWNVVVVVSRWYGGTLLGSDRYVTCDHFRYCSILWYSWLTYRFRHINNCAREALERGGFITKK